MHITNQINQKFEFTVKSLFRLSLVMLCWFQPIYTLALSFCSIELDSMNQLNYNHSWNVICHACIGTLRDKFCLLCWPRIVSVSLMIADIILDEWLGSRWPSPTLCQAKWCCGQQLDSKQQYAMFDAVVQGLLVFSIWLLVKCWFSSAVQKSCRMDPVGLSKICSGRHSCWTQVMSCEYALSLLLFPHDLSIN